MSKEEVASEPPGRGNTPQKTVEVSGSQEQVVGMTGLEPATSWSRTKRSTRLSYIPI